ncbi:hypothetical protein L0B53_00010 [Vibrio sp. SS-MA-C1-2]|uniref:hypothetical protein n=1 Tax=Vibrio sp. SS-MA-C1-2 TaxID=2908646 RepID=UPI001F262BB6|nr:hypothetical protein [Vibrio sp. SS-MA-C1-2]UJF17198.1 hypothetical protein L0B53_00010 [Vibrio sp. SS-MA-C1-2]
MQITYTRGDVISQTTFTPTSDHRGQIEELIGQGVKAKQKLSDFMRRLSKEVNNESGQPIKFQSTSVPIKGRARIADKCGIVDWDNPAKDKKGSNIKEPLIVKDIARATIIFSTIVQLEAVRDFIYEQDEYRNLKDKQSPAVKDLWGAGVHDVYKDVKFFLEVNIQWEGKTIPHIVELQLNVGSMDKGKKYEHAFYNIKRKAFLGAEKQIFIWDDPKCKITIKTKEKAKIATKLRTSLVNCKQLASGNKEQLLAVKILSKMLADDFNYSMTDASYKNTGPDITINGYEYKHKNGDGPVDKKGRAWAINCLSRLVCGRYTDYQRLAKRKFVHSDNIFDAK